ncbi:MAG TPA: hypothetical protein H9971_07175 [Candidatus Dorea merdavium]|nr:hypothetical protein [Candidatus Dorea merdavium]
MERTERKVNLAEAIILLAIFVIIMIYGALWGGFPTAMSVVYCAIVAGIYGCAVLHISWEKMFNNALSVVQSAMPAMYFLMLTGFVSASWIASGTIPYMIYLGLEIISPQIFLFTAFLLCFIASMATGSSWAIVSSVGLALGAIATGLGIPLPIAVGAIVSGAFCGDKWSPLSDTPNLAAAVSGQNILKVFTNLISTSGFGSIIAALIFLVQGFLLHASGTSSLSDVTSLTQQLSELFNFNIFLLVPLIFVIVLCVMKLPPLPVVAGGVAIGMIEALIFQGVTFSEITNIVWSGYVSDSGNEVIDSLLTRGGCTSLSELLLLLFMAFVFAGFLNEMGVLDVIADRITRVIKGTGSLVLCSLLTSVLGVFLSASVYVSIILNTQMYDKAYRKAGLDRVNLSRTTLEGTAMWGGMIPYSGGGVLVLAATGVAAWTYLPYCYGTWISMLLTVIWAFTRNKRFLPTAKYDENLEPVEES